MAAAVLGTTLHCANALAQDADGDGVRDVRDRCAGTPGGTVVDRAGCDAFCEATNVGADQFMRTRHIEVGAAAGASYGTSVAPPAGWHPRGESGPGIGFVADPNRTNWTNFHGDFFLPGSPEEAWGLSVDGAHFMNADRNGVVNIPGAFSSTSVCADNICGVRAGARMVWEGEVANIGIEQTYSIVTEGFYILMEVTLTNNSATPHEVYYMRNVDPDNMVTLSTDYTTQNTIVSQGTGVAGMNAVVTATTPEPFLSFLALGSADPDARVSYGGFSERAPSNAWNCTGYSCTVGDTVFEDIAIQLTVRKTIPARGSVHFSYVYTLTPPAIVEAIGCTIPAVCGNGLLEGAEACDDGNMSANDGCSTICNVEDGWTCDDTVMPTRCRMLCRSGADCRDGNDCTLDVCDLGDCLNPIAPVGTTCATGVCLGTAATCVSCVSDLQCAGATPFCNTTANTCGPCVSDFGGVDAACPEATPLCLRTGPLAGACGRCTTMLDCAGNAAGPICDFTSGLCGTTCRTDAECASDQWCPTSGVCAPKVPNGMSVPSQGPANGECTSTIGTRTCLSQVCFADDDLCGLPNGEPCAASAACRSDICAANGLCGACDGDEDCMSGMVCDIATGACETPVFPDAAVSPDAAVGVDAGRSDVGMNGNMSDAGVTAPDSGMDAGPTHGGLAGGAFGCAVSTTRSQSGLLAMLGVLALVAARRRRAR